MIGAVRPILFLVSLLTLAVVAVVLWPRDAQAPADVCGATTAIIDVENVVRRLRENSLLSAASLEHSQDMVRRDYFDHTTPDGRTVGTRLRALGYARGVSASS